MSDTGTTPTEAMTQWIDEVTATLADLDPSTRDDLLEDLDLLVMEATDETGLTPVAALGEPAAFAAELREAAGIEGPPPGQHRRAAVPAGVHEAGRRLLTDLRDGTAWRNAVSFLPELRGGWWVLRAYLLVAIPSLILFSGDGSLSFLIPRPFGSGLIGTLLFLLAARWSIGRGRQAADQPTSPWGLVGAAGLIGLALVVIGGRAAEVHYPEVVYAEPAFASGYAVEPCFSEWGEDISCDGHTYPGNDGSTFLRNWDGTPITNIWAYGLDGEPVEVVLYDQLGRPIDNLLWDEQGIPLEPDFDDRSITNRFPRTWTAADEPVMPYRDPDVGPGQWRPALDRPPVDAPIIVEGPAATTVPPTTTTVTPTTGPTAPTTTTTIAEEDPAG